MGVHHVELWVTDGPAAWGGEHAAYLVIEQSPSVTGPHDRLRAGLNHLALHVADRGTLDAIVEEAGAHGWTQMYADRHPHAGGPDSYAAYLEDADGFELELVAP